MTEKEIVHYDIQKMAAEALAEQKAWVSSKEQEDLLMQATGLARRMRDICRADGALVSTKQTSGNLRDEEFYVEGFFADMPEIRFTTDFDAWENTIAIVGTCPACQLETVGVKISSLESLGAQLEKLAKDGFVPIKSHQRKCTPDPETEPAPLTPTGELLAGLEAWHNAIHGGG